jgi:eukaryotic-like serine/threonine-protein kinase
MARLRHPRLVQVFDYGVLDSGPSYFTMELLGGKDLSSLGRLSLASIYQVLLSIADVLGFMHARGYVHRDVKPSNVRVLPTDPGQPIEVKLMDFGLTEQLGRAGSAVAGTLAHSDLTAGFAGHHGTAAESVRGARASHCSANANRPRVGSNRCGGWSGDRL